MSIFDVPTFLKDANASAKKLTSQANNAMTHPGQSATTSLHDLGINSPAISAYGRNADTLMRHPLSSSTGGLLGGDAGVVDFTGYSGPGKVGDGRGVQNSSLQGGLSNKNNRYGAIAYGSYLGGSNLFGGESGGSAAAGGGDAGGSAAGAGAGGGWQQYAKMGSGMMGGGGGGGSGGGTSPGTYSNQQMQQQTEELMRKQQEKVQQQEMIAELLRRYQNGA
jgi:hypothetical protein